MAVSNIMTMEESRFLKEIIFFYVKDAMKGRGFFEQIAGVFIETCEMFMFCVIWKVLR